MKVDKTYIIIGDETTNKKFILKFINLHLFFKNVQIE
jgi:hypothetical protein